MFLSKLLGVGPLLLLPAAGLAQHAVYNRWEARPVPTPRPVRATPVSPLLGRYWRQGLTTDSEAAGRALLSYLARTMRYPAQAMRTQTEGQVIVRMLVTPQGQPSQVRVLRHILTTAAPDTSAFRLLDAEALRVVGTLRFNPAAQTDTVVIPLNFNFE